MCDIPDVRGMSAREINKVLNEYRRKMNSDVEKRCVKLVRDEDDMEEVVLQVAERKAVRIEQKKHPDDYVEISEEKVEEIINTHSDLK